MKITQRPLGICSNIPTELQYGALKHDTCRIYFFRGEWLFSYFWRKQFPNFFVLLQFYSSIFIVVRNRCNSPVLLNLSRFYACHCKILMLLNFGFTHRVFRLNVNLISSNHSILFVIRRWLPFHNNRARIEGFGSYVSWFSRHLKNILWTKNILKWIISPKMTKVRNYQLQRKR